MYLPSSNFSVISIKNSLHRLSRQLASPGVRTLKPPEKPWLAIITSKNPLALDETS